MDAPNENATTSIFHLVGTEAFRAAAKSFTITAEMSPLEVRADINGLKNPSIMDNHFWNYMVYNGNSPYGIRKKNGWEDENAYDRPPMWTFTRLGHSRTDLPDGRRVFIAGEYDDSYDPDFFIYNDVVVVDPRIKPFGPASVTIYGYPLDVFPPTDHHTSTLYTEPASGKQYIAIIGGQGDGRLEGPHKDSTTLYRLDLQDFKIEKMSLNQAGAPTKPLVYHRAQLLETEEVESLFSGRQGSVIVKLTTSTFGLNHGFEQAEDDLQFGDQSDLDGNPKEEILGSPPASNAINDELEEPEEPKKAFVRETYYLDLIGLQWIRT